MTRRAGMAAVAAIGLAAVATPAMADAIDGDWCADDGRHMSIRGSAITTPGGTETAGSYRRHSFAYVTPEGEDGAGEPVAMVLLNENTTRVETGGETEIWLRCKPAIS